MTCRIWRNTQRDSAITAWVCANDIVAILAQRFLATAPHAKSPNRIAIIGFDDLPIATENDITSYNFAPTLFIDNVVGFIVHPRQEYYKDKTRIEVEGLLIERGSSKNISV